MPIPVTMPATDSPMKALIRQMFAANPSPLPDQAPAIEAAVMFACGGSAHGSLSETPDGLLRLMSPLPPNDQRATEARRRGKVLMVEQFFTYDMVASIGVLTQVDVNSPRVISG